MAETRPLKRGGSRCTVRKRTVPSPKGPRATYEIVVAVGKDKNRAKLIRAAISQFVYERFETPSQASSAPPERSA